MKERQNGIPSVLVETIAGLTAGFLSTLVAHPLDLIKVRLQAVDRESRTPKLGATWRIARNVIANEGRGALYRGFSPNLVGNMTSWGLFFMLYGEIKSGVTNHKRGDLSSIDYLLSSGTAGVLTAICTNPLWVVKTRMLSSGRSVPGAYLGLTDGLRTILRDEGARGLFRGLVPALFGVGQGALQFMFYEELKLWRRRLHGRSEKVGGGGLSNIDFLTLSAASKILSGSIIYPYRVVQTRMQTYDADAVYSSARDAVIKIWRREGLTGFYKGLAPNLARVLPSTCITFLVYENTRYYLQ
ncbi:mitochondrial carrier domain-containing protein [Tuber borchii]|uniref:Mitochondrial carrier domain-containing protein n=1 Tax=Tuber borchii TaxID=42251 RepID=A0A2T6ZE29_TUBBO|nr:mitochondrial carrier domain-containing protein [Tuber borchii]